MHLNAWPCSIETGHGLENCYNKTWIAVNFSSGRKKLESKYSKCNKEQNGCLPQPAHVGQLGKTEKVFVNLCEWLKTRDQNFSLWYWHYEKEHLYLTKNNCLEFILGSDFCLWQDLLYQIDDITLELTWEKFPVG